MLHAPTKLPSVTLRTNQRLDPTGKHGEHGDLGWDLGSDLGSILRLDLGSDVGLDLGSDYVPSSNR